MRSKGSRFTLGIWGLRVCSLDVAPPFATLRNRSQPFTNRLREVAMAVPMGECCKSGRFWRFKRCATSFSCGRRGTLWHRNMFHNVSKIFPCDRRNTFLRRFQKMTFMFRGRPSTLDVSIFILRGRHSTFDGWCCVFLRIALSGLRQVVTTCIAWQAWHFVTCDENWEKPRTKHRFWGSQFRGFIKKTRRKTSILELSSVKILGGFIRNKRFGLPICLISMQNLSFWNVSNEVYKSVVLRGRGGASWHSHVSHIVSRVVLCDMRNTFARFSEDKLIFLRQAQHFGDLHCHFAWQAQHFRPVVLRLLCESHCQGCVKWWQRANCVAGVGHRESLLYILHSTLHTLHSALYTSRFTLDTWHSTL